MLGAGKRHRPCRRQTVGLYGYGFSGFTSYFMTLILTFSGSGRARGTGTSRGTGSGSDRTGSGSGRARASGRGRASGRVRGAGSGSGRARGSGSGSGRETRGGRGRARGTGSGSGSLHLFPCWTFGRFGRYGWHRTIGFALDLAPIATPASLVAIPLLIASPPKSHTSGAGDGSLAPTLWNRSLLFLLYQSAIGIAGAIV